ncbi:MAG: hypothetical protein AAFR21_16050 [Pseudomonadota bacterium]
MNSFRELLLQGIDRRQLMACTVLSAFGSQFSNEAVAKKPDRFSPDFEDADDLLELMRAEADGAWRLTESHTRTMRESEWEPIGRRANDWSWWTLPQDQQRPVAWPKPKNDVDAESFANWNVAEADIKVSHDTLSWLAERNSFDLTYPAFDARNTDEIVIVGLRGAALADGSYDSGWASSHLVSREVPDHINHRCLLGAWSRRHKIVRLFKASTVPEVSYMWLQLLLEEGANLLPTGLYAYEVGPHGLSHQRTTQVGALRLAGHAFPKRGNTIRDVNVLRSLNDLTYSVGDATEIWDICQPSDNIHASIFGSREKYLVGAKNQHFSSAGCHTVPGGYALKYNGQGRRAFTTEPIGPWREFRAALGLSASPEMTGSITTTDDGRQFYYMLLSGWDAAIASTGDNEARQRYWPLRAGSSGKRVEALQRSLHIEVDGAFGPATADRLILTKKIELQIAESPIALPSMGF